MGPGAAVRPTAGRQSAGVSEATAQAKAAVSQDTPPYPQLHLAPKRERRLLAGHPWVYSNELRLGDAERKLPPGTLVNLVASTGRHLGTAFFNPRPLIAARLLTTKADTPIDAGWLDARLERAAALRARLTGAPFYRLVHAEGDGLPGLIVDRFDRHLVVQVNVAGFERLRPALEEALTERFRPQSIQFRNDTPARALEGLDATPHVVGTPPDAPVEVPEGGATFLADLTGGQKTGWFFDQRANRALVAGFAAGARVLDVYCHTGGFAVQAAVAGAAQVVGVDRSAPAQELAQQAADASGVAARCRFERAEAFAALEAKREAGERYDIVVCDPPAFAKSKKDVPAAARGYRKLARQCAGLVAPGGLLFTASCSHNISPETFADCVAKGLNDTRRTGRVLATVGAAPDHPVHPHLPETAYLKGQLLQVD